MLRCIVRDTLALFLCLPLTLCCQYNPNDQIIRCPSFQAFGEADNPTEWNKLIIINYGNESMTTVKKDAFLTTPNLSELYLRGIANEMEEGAFNGLNKIRELHFDDNKLHVIRSRQFADLPVYVIYIYNSEVHELQPKAFDRNPGLRDVFLYDNNIPKIEAGVFTGTKIKFINLKKNKIKYLAPNAFGDMENLDELVLTDNELTLFEPQFVMGHAPKLKLLFLTRNKLSAVTRDMFTPLPNLQILLLNINRIERIGENAFVDLPILKTLDVSNNRLEELRMDVFKASGMHSFLFLFLHDNQLSFLSNGVLVRLPRLTWMSVGGNPWQCPCWDVLNDYMIHNNVTRLCYEEYTQGNRPFCVFSETHPRDCIPDVENVRDMPQIFLDTLKEYSELPPVCRSDGVNKPGLVDNLK